MSIRAGRNRKLSPVTEGQRLAEFSLAVRDSSMKRLRAVPDGQENHRPRPGRMSFADLAQHLIDADRWLLQKMVDPDVARMSGRAGLVTIEERETYVELLSRLEQSGIDRATRLASLPDGQLFSMVNDDRFGGEVSVWWIVVRGNLDHEIHHRGQLDERLRNLLSTV